MVRFPKFFAMLCGILAVGFFLVSQTQMSAKSARKHGKPVIGVIGSYNSEKGTVTAGSSYLNCIVKANGIPVVIPFCTSREMAGELLSMVDGIIVTGGADVQPEWYGETVLNETVSCSPGRDTSEMYLIHEAVRRNIPILAICRGHQIVNVALGGSLYQDIPSQIPGCLVHRQQEPSSITTQTVVLEKDSHMAKLMGTDTLRSNSHHHQAVKVAGNGLRIVGRATDGVAEICEGLPQMDILTIQFHPEKLVDSGDMYYLPVFTDLVKRAHRFANTR